MGMAEKSPLTLAFDCLSHAKRPLHVADLCERLAGQFSDTLTPATMHVLLRLDPRFESHGRYHWYVAPPPEHIPTLLEVTKRIAHYIRSQGKRFLPEEALAAFLAHEYDLSPIESLRLVREASATYTTRIPRAGINIFLAQEDSSAEEV